MANTRRVTQETVEVLGANATPNSRVTQETVEVLGANATPNSRVTLAYVEVLTPLPVTQRAGWGILLN